MPVADGLMPAMQRSGSLEKSRLRRFFREPYAVPANKKRGFCRLLSENVV